jgi:hypothetical protein
MRALPNDDTALNIDLSPSAQPTQPGSIDPAVLRRAMKYGQKMRERARNRTFREAEADLRAGWGLRGETTEWDWVQAAVRVGYEQDAPEEDV